MALTKVAWGSKSGPWWSSPLPKFAARYNVPVEVLQQAGGDHVVATLNPVKVITNG